MYNRSACCHCSLQSPHSTQRGLITMLPSKCCSQTGFLRVFLCVCLPVLLHTSCGVIVTKWVSVRFLAIPAGCLMDPQSVWDIGIFIAPSLSRSINNIRVLSHPLCQLECQRSNLTLPPVAHTQRHRLTLTQIHTGSRFRLCSPHWPPPPRYPEFNVFIRKQRLCDGREKMNLYSTSWSGMQLFCCRTTWKYTVASPSSPSSSF